MESFEVLLRTELLAHAIRAYDIGYLLLAPDLSILQGNLPVTRWLDRPLGEVVGQEATVAFPELVGIEPILHALKEGDAPIRFEDVYRSSDDALGQYFDLEVQCLGQGSGLLLLTTTDVTRKARQEFLLQQQRNEVQLLSAELSAANERLNYILNRLVPPAVAQLMISDRQKPEPGVKLAGEATILFADMRDFTVIAEAYQPADTLEFLNIYLAIVAEAILRHDGSLVQLVGDMVMGVFNLPDSQPDHPLRAVRAALDIQDSLRTFNETADARFPAVSFGVGISTGSVIAGYLGFQQRFRYAVVGDATNVAFHLSSLAAPGRILMSESTLRAADAPLVVREKGAFQLKSRRNSVKVYELHALSLGES